MKQGNSVEFNEVSRIFGNVVALNSFSLSIKPGELITLLGPSGCGKTTALRVLAGIDKFHTGSVSINDEVLTSVPAYRRNIGMVFQAYSLFPNMTVAENISYGLRMRGHNAKSRRDKAFQMLELVGMSSLAKRKPSELSGGQQQRVALARALEIRTQLREEIRRIQRALGITTIFVSHDQQEAMSISDRVGVLNNGVLEQIDTPSVLYNNPSSNFVAEFIGLNNKIPGFLTEQRTVRVLGQNINVSDASPSGQKGEEVRVLLRPETIVLSKENGQFRIISKSFLGSITRFEIDCRNENLVAVELGSAVAKDFDTGDFVNLFINVDNVMVTKL